MLKTSEAGFRRLLPLLRPHLPQLSLGLVCMLIYVSSFLLLLNLAGHLRRLPMSLTLAAHTGRSPSRSPLQSGMTAVKSQC